MKFWSTFIRLVLTPVFSVVAVFAFYLVFYGDYSVATFLLFSVVILTVGFMFACTITIKLVNFYVKEKGDLSTVQLISRLFFTGFFWLLQFLMTLMGWFLILTG